MGHDKYLHPSGAHRSSKVLEQAQGNIFRKQVGEVCVQVLVLQTDRRRKSVSICCTYSTGERLLKTVKRLSKLPWTGTVILMHSYSGNLHFDTVQREKRDNSALHISSGSPGDPAIAHTHSIQQPRFLCSFAVYSTGPMVR